MSQTSKKISSFIGITLLVAIVAFTVFINFYEEETIKEVEVYKETDAIEVEEPKDRIFNSTDAANFWKLEGLRIKKIPVNEARVYIAIKKDSSNTGVGVLGFNHDEQLLSDAEVISLNPAYYDSTELLEIGSILIEYEIQNLTTPHKGFTIIELADEREVFLVKPNTEIKNDYYKDVLEGGTEYINDSTRITESFFFIP